MDVEGAASAVIEILLDVVSDHSGLSNYLVRFRTERDLALRTKHLGYLVAQSKLPSDIPINPAVETLVKKVFEGCDVVCKPAVDPEFGRCFELDVQVEIPGASWDRFRSHRMQK